MRLFPKGWRPFVTFGRPALFLGGAMILARSLFALPPAPAGTLAEFRFDGSFVNAGTNNLALQGAAAQYTTDRHGQAGRALLSPPDGLVGSSSADFFKNRRSWTWMGWVRVDEAHESETGAIYSEGNNGMSAQIAVYQRRFWLQTFNETVAGGWSTLQTEPVARLGEWVHVAVTLNTPPDANAGTARIHLNGTLAATGTLPIVRIDSSKAAFRQFAFGMNVGYFLGGQTLGPYRFRGALDDVLIVDRAMSTAEIREFAALPETLRVATAVELFFPTEIGRRYRLERSVDLATWEPHGGLIEGTGSEVSVFASSRDGIQRYWRLAFID